MIPRPCFLNKLRDLGYHFNRKGDTVELWKKGTHFVPVRTNKQLSEEYVVRTLRLCGLSADEIKQFLDEAEG